MYFLYCVRLIFWMNNVVIGLYLYSFIQNGNTRFTNIVLFSGDIACNFWTERREYPPKLLWIILFNFVLTVVHRSSVHRVGEFVLSNVVEAALLLQLSLSHRHLRRLANTYDHLPPLQYTILLLVVSARLVTARWLAVGCFIGTSTSSCIMPVCRS